MHAAVSRDKFKHVLYRKGHIKWGGQNNGGIKLEKRNHISHELIGVGERKLRVCS